MVTEREEREERGGGGWVDTKRTYHTTDTQYIVGYKYNPLYNVIVNLLQFPYDRSIMKVEQSNR